MGARDVGEIGVLLARRALHFAEAAGEFGGGFFSGDFGVDVEEAGEVDGDEEDVAEFGFDAAWILLRRSEDLAEFAGFLVEFVEDAVDVVPVKADASGSTCELVALEKSGEGGGDAVQEGLGGGRRNRRGQRLRETLLFFDDFPVAEDLGGVFGALLAEDVGVAANHFLVNFVDDVGDGEAAFFLCDLGVEENLEKQVAEFFAELGVVGGFEGVKDFVGFFNKIRAKSGVSLFAVPRAAARRAEARHEGNKLYEGGTDTRRRSEFRFAWCAGRTSRRFAFGFARGHGKFQ